MSAEVTPDVQEPAFHDIPREQLKEVQKFLKSKGGWQRTPSPIIEALKTAGFNVRITKKGTAESRGDTLELSRPHNTEMLYACSTDETVKLLKDIIGEQRTREKHRKLEKEMEEAILKDREDAPLPVKEDPEVAVVANTLPVTQDGEVLQNQAPNTKDFLLSDAGIEDAVILSETPRPNIGKGKVQKPAALTAEILKDEKSEDDDVAYATDEMLRERASRIATMRAEILESEEGGEEETLELRAEISPTPEQPKTLDESVLSAFGVTNEKWEQIPGRGKFSTEEIEKVVEGMIKEASLTPERTQMFDERFASEFGVTNEMWNRISGSEKLSFAQQKLVFENLREFSERDKAPYLARVWEGIKEKLGSKKDVGPTLDALSRLVESAAQYGPKVHEEAGELMIDFVGIEMPRENRKEWKQAFDSLNEAAHRLSKTPASWQEDGIGTHSEKESKMMSFIKESFSPARKRFNEYKEIEEEYVVAKKELNRILEAAHINPLVIADRLVDIDKNVYALQFLQTSPDAVEAVKDIPDEKMWKKVVKSMIKPGNFVYMGLGALGRTALAGALGGFAAPVTSAVIEGGRAWDRSAALMRERDRAARMGTRDTSDEALNIVSAEMSIDIDGKKYEVGATQKLQYLIDKYGAFRQTHDIEGPTSPEYIKDMNTLLESIRVRASYVEDKQRLNRINFGNKEERAVQMAKLYETLAFAKMIIADNSNFPKIDEPIPDWRKDKNPKTLEERLASELMKNENNIQNKRRTRQIKSASWNALRAGGFAAAGVFLVQEIQELGLEEESAKLGGAQGVKGITAHDGPLLTPDEAARASADSAATPPGDAPLRMETAIPKAAEVPKLESYTIRPGDTLTKIMKEQLPEIQELGAGKSQNTAIANILRELSPEELKSIGVRSGNPDLIYAGDPINTEALHKIIESHQSIIDDVASRGEGVAKVAEETGKVTVKVPEDSIVFNPSSKDDYFPGPTNASEQLNLRTLIYKDATENTERWMRLYPRANAQDAVKAGIVEGHFKNLFGEKWATTGEVRVTDLLTRGPQFQNEDPNRLMNELKKLVETVEKPPMNVVPQPAENMKEYLERASMAYAQRGDGIPGDNLIRKIETYYQASKR